jgi:superfamily II DNA or RNA helicase
MGLRGAQAMMPAITDLRDPGPQAAGDAVAAGPARGLRRYQVEATGAVTAWLRDGGAGQLRMACGTGKTRVAAHVAGCLAGDGGVVVMLVPGLVLAAQTIRDWQAGCPVDQVLAVCSDDTVGGMVRGAGLVVPVTTDPEVIAKWLSGVYGRALVVGTYDSAHRVAEGLRLAGQVAELMVCDEAHRLAGHAGKFTAQVLMPGFMPARRRLFMTATPKVVTGAAGGGELAVASMDDEAVFGPVLHDYPFRQAISDGWLKDYRIVIATVTSRQVADLLDGNADLVGERDVPVRMAAAQAALAMAAAEFGLRRCVAFLPRIAQARQFAATLPATLAMLPEGRRPAGQVSAGHVHGTMTSTQRDLALDRLRHPPDGGWAVVANPRCLTEGVDIPAVDSILFATPKESPVDIVQAIGRALRPHGDADTATIIVPALLPDDGQDAGPQDGGRYETVLRVVRAMCAHDKALTARLDAARVRRAAAPPDQPAELPSQITVLAPPGTLGATLDALRIHVVAGTTSSWLESYGHARAHHGEHGDLDVPGSHVTAGGFRLGNWLSWQRTDRNRGALADDRVQLLDSLGMTWDQVEAAWMDSYRELSAFAGQHGHFEVPRDQRTADGTGLATWAHHQRQADRKGTITPARKELLDQIGFPWDATEARWMRRYQQLAQALARHGSPRDLPPGSPEAGWLEAQHNTFRKGRLPASKIALLQEAGIQVRPADPWTDGCQALAALKAANGHLRIPQGYKTPGGHKLANWASRQRANWKAGLLTTEQAWQLEELGFSLDPDADLWHARYQEARAWKEEHGHFALPAKHSLRHWLYTQRKTPATAGSPTTGPSSCATSAHSTTRNRNTTGSPRSERGVCGGYVGGTYRPGTTICDSLGDVAHCDLNVKRHPSWASTKSRCLVRRRQACERASARGRPPWPPHRTGRCHSKSPVTVCRNRPGYADRRISSPGLTRLATTTPTQITWFCATAYGPVSRRAGPLLACLLARNRAHQPSSRSAQGALAERRTGHRTFGRSEGRSAWLRPTWAGTRQSRCNGV